MDNVAIKKLYSGNTARQRASGTGGMVSDRGREKNPYVIRVILGGYDAKCSIHLGTCYYNDALTLCQIL